ncbi:hypothetical protein [Bacillus sp. Marseille-P3661]|uniref:hypothetical protein n=1 Tax=Bacillus sp. Marseille-P3661 TaxID=1936234 RepID=UPI000C817F16|nr:hypothetical protein [Bacillus sp. Marseille-P3661]
MEQQSLHDIVQQAQKMTNEAYHKKDDAENLLRQCEEQLQRALNVAQQQVKMGHVLQQIQDAQNAVEQAKNAATQIHTNREVALNSVEQAVRACNQIQV